MAPEAVRWGSTEHLLAGVYDLLAISIWQRGGGKGPRPKPLKRPGAGGETKRIGSGGLPIHELDEWLAEHEPTPMPPAGKELVVWQPLPGVTT